MSDPALLALEDGTLYRGVSVGASGQAVGEVVFNTAMTGYQEILTDPSYHRQVVTLTCPHVGNVGTNPQDDESAAVHAAALVVRDHSIATSSWRSREPLGEWLRARSVVAIAGIDTRALTRRLREKGAQRGCVMAGQRLDAEEAVAAARAFPGLSGADLAREVTTPTPYRWQGLPWRAPEADGAPPRGAGLRVAVLDLGVKHNILRLLAARGCEVTVLPATTPAEEVLALDPHGVLLSNGPGDPAACGYAIEAARALIADGRPLFGICLGHQILALAAGARTVKMKFGHHGANHPVQELASGRVFITSQNHGFTVDEASLPGEVEVTHRSLFDGTVQGIAWRGRPVFGFQGHPEASPGPHDLEHLFDRFVALMREHPAG